MYIPFIVYIFLHRIRFSFFLVAINAVYIVISGDRLWMYVSYTYNTHAPNRNTQHRDFICLFYSTCKLFESQMGLTVLRSHFHFAVACKANTNTNAQLRWATAITTFLWHTFYLFAIFVGSYHLCKMKWFTKQLGIFIMLIIMLLGEM